MNAPGAAAGCCEKAGCGAASAAPSGACGGGGGAYWTGGGARNGGGGGGTNDAKLRSFSEPPLSDTVTDCVAKAVRSGGGGGAILEGEAGSGGAAAAISTCSLKVTDLRSAVVAARSWARGASRVGRGRPAEFLVGGRGRPGAGRGGAGPLSQTARAVAQGQFCVEKSPSRRLRAAARRRLAAGSIGEFVEVKCV